MLCVVCMPAQAALFFLILCRISSGRRRFGRGFGSGRNCSVSKPMTHASSPTLPKTTDGHDVIQSGVVRLGCRSHEERGLKRQCSVRCALRRQSPPRTSNCNGHPLFIPALQTEGFFVGPPAGGTLPPSSPSAGRPPGCCRCPCHRLLFVHTPINAILILSNLRIFLFPVSW